MKRIILAAILVAITALSAQAAEITAEGGGWAFTDGRNPSVDIGQAVVEIKDLAFVLGFDAGLKCQQQVFAQVWENNTALHPMTTEEQRQAYESCYKKAKDSFHKETDN